MEKANDVPVIPAGPGPPRPAVIMGEMRNIRKGLLRVDDVLSPLSHPVQIIPSRRRRESNPGPRLGVGVCVGSYYCVSRR